MEPGRRVWVQVRRAAGTPRARARPAAAGHDEAGPPQPQERDEGATFKSGLSPIQGDFRRRIKNSQKIPPNGQQILQQ
eukprot:3068606-Pyramimonas_sp.AAC.1